MHYQISACAVLYVLRKSGHRGIYGVQNVLAGLNKAARDAAFQQAELELMAAGLGSMDFDGVFTPEAELTSLIGDCAECKHILSASMRRDGMIRSCTCFRLGEKTCVLEQTDKDLYAIYTDTDAAARVTAFFGLPQRESALKEISVDSALIQHRDRDGLVEAGCSEALAALVTDAARGVGGYAQFSRIIGDTMTELETILYGDAGIVTVAVEYTWGQELFRLTPVSADWVAESIRKLLV